MTGWILEPCYSHLQTPKFQCLVLDDGQQPEWLEAAAVTLDGERWMPSFGESPSVAVECSLSQILQENVSSRYSLSLTACAGILRRAERRGKVLPDALAEALHQQMTTLKDNRQEQMNL
jgi:hypothetical protein